MKKAIPGIVSILLSITLIMLAFNIQATMSSGPLEIQWSKAYGGSKDESGCSVVQTSDQGYAIAGVTGSYGVGSYDLWIVKTDALGNVVWNRTYGGTNGEAQPTIVKASDGGYAIAAVTDSFGAGSNDFWLVKTDADGNAQWNKTYGGSDTDCARYMILTQDGGYAIVGFTASYGAGAYDFLFVKTDAAGNMQWYKTYGGSSYDQAYCIVQTNDGCYTIAGFTQSYGAGGRDIWLVKTDTAGDMLWGRTYGGSGNDYPSYMIQTCDGGYATVGITDSFGAGDNDFWLVKTDADGNMEWHKTYGGTGEDNAASLAICDGGYILAGHTRSFGAADFDMWLVKTNSDGSEISTLMYGGSGSDSARFMVPTTDGGWAVVGRTASYGAGGFDLWLVKVIEASPSKVLATLDIDPDTLNLKSRGEWITGYIELPELHDVADVNVSTLELNDTVPAQCEPVAIGDYDNDEVLDLMVKFNRTEISQYILSEGIKCGNATLTVTGMLKDGTSFEGSDTIRVRMPGDVNCDGRVNIKDIVFVAKAFKEWLHDPCYYLLADLNEDQKVDSTDYYMACLHFGKTY